MESEYFVLGSTEPPEQKVKEIDNYITAVFGFLPDAYEAFTMYLMPNSSSYDYFNNSTHDKKIINWS